jgi:hypothetical protein
MIHAGDMPTLATQASCSEQNKPLNEPLVQIAPVNTAAEAVNRRTNPWQA